MRSWVLAIVVLGAALLPAVEPAEAYELNAARWAQRTIPFHSTVGAEGSVAQAVRAWNRSGVRLRWRAVAKRDARVLIRRRDTPGALGYARYHTGGGGRVLRATIDIAPGLRAGDMLVAVVAHEMGHVLGLGHEERRCAVMNASVLRACGAVEGAPWQRRCRFLQRDDLRGARRIYGGRLRKLPPPFCEVVPAPTAPAAVGARLEGEEVVVGVALPAAHVAGVLVARYDNACPADLNGQQALTRQVAQREARPGERIEVRDTPYARGRYCYAAFVRDAFGRFGPMASAVVDHPGPPPVAQFQAFDRGDLHVEFTSFAGNDVPVAGWRWDFGDGTSSTESAPVHAYAAPGVYPVTLTVTDAGGRSASATRAVDVAPPPLE